MLPPLEIQQSKGRLLNEVEGGGIRNEGDNALAIHDWWQWCEGRIEQENGVSGGLKIRQVARKGFLEDEGVRT